MKTGIAILFGSLLAATAGEGQVPGNPGEFALFVAEAGRGGLI